MTSVIGTSLSDYGLFGRLVGESASVRQRLDNLTRQASDGLVAETYSGLGSGGSASLGLDHQIASLHAGQSNIDAATGRMQIAQTALGQLQSIAADFNSRLNNLNGLNASNVDTVAADARSALSQVADLLNTKAGDVYVFSGEDSANPPVPNPATIMSSGFYTQIQSAVSQLSTSGASAVAAVTLDVASSDAVGITPFSDYLSGGSASRPTIDTADGQRPIVGVLANANGAVASTGASTTGSYVRDLMRSLATLGSLTSSQLSTPEFAGLVQDTRTSLGGSISAMAADTGVLGNTQAGLGVTRTQLDTAAIALSTQVSASRDVDMAAVLSGLTRVQSQLQASYQLIGTLSGLSLSKFLPGG